MLIYANFIQIFAASTTWRTCTGRFRAPKRLRTGTKCWPTEASCRPAEAARDFWAEWWVPEWPEADHRPLSGPPDRVLPVLRAEQTALPFRPSHPSHPTTPESKSTTTTECWKRIRVTTALIRSKCHLADWLRCCFRRPDSELCSRRIRTRADTCPCTAATAAPWFRHFRHRRPDRRMRALCGFRASPTSSTTTTWWRRTVRSRGWRNSTIRVTANRPIEGLWWATCTDSLPEASASQTIRQMTRNIRPFRRHPRRWTAPKRSDTFLLYSFCLQKNKWLVFIKSMK